MSIWSALRFQFDKTPAFLPGADDVTDRVTGYLLIVEQRDYVAIFKSQIDVPTVFTKRHLQRISAQDVERVLTSKDSVFARVRLRHMTLSHFALRSKTLEGENPEPVTQKFVHLLGAPAEIDDCRLSSMNISTGKVLPGAAKSGYFICPAL